MYAGDAPKLATFALRRGIKETYAFTQAFRDALDRGMFPHCLNAGDYWLSESAADRRIAEQLCRGCPVILECRTAATARKERWGVWGGVDRSPRGKKAQRSGLSEVV
jgi:hypothetical protein